MLIVSEGARLFGRVARRSGSEPVRPPDGAAAGVTLHSQTNFRSPRQNVEMLAAIGAVLRRGGGSPFKGADFEELTYREDDTEAMLAQTKRAVTLCLTAGFARQDIAIASFRGREHRRSSDSTSWTTRIR